MQQRLRTASQYAGMDAVSAAAAYCTNTQKRGIVKIVFIPTVRKSGTRWHPLEWG